MAQTGYGWTLTWGNDVAQSAEQPERNGYGITVISCRVRDMQNRIAATDSGGVLAGQAFVVLDVEIDADDYSRFRAGDVVRVGSNFPPMGGIASGEFAITDAVMDVRRPFLWLSLTSLGPVGFIPPPATSVARPQPLPFAPPPPPPPMPIVRTRPAGPTPPAVRTTVKRPETERPAPARDFGHGKRRIDLEE